MNRKWLSMTVMVLLVLLLGIGGATAQEPEGDISAQATVGTAFTYQGRLTDGGSPANGDYDFQFRLYDDDGSGNLVGTNTLSSVTVTEGLFTVELDFGDVFDGTAYWLDIGVRPNGSGTYTTLTPRQPLTPAPYAHTLRPGASIVGSVSGSILRVANSAAGDGVQVDSAGGDGVYVHSAGSPSTTTPSILSNGFEVAGAERYGLYVGRADDDGVYVTSAGGNGLSVKSANNDGLYVGSAGSDGLYVDSTGSDGMSVHEAGSPSTTDASTDNNGFEVAGAEGHGLYVGQADLNGVYVRSAEGNGVAVLSAENDGVHVNSAGDDGVAVFSAGSPSTTNLSTDKNGFEVAGTEGYGLYVGRADLHGVYVNSTEANGVYVDSAGSDGVNVHSAGGAGVRVGSVDDGLYVSQADDDGVYVHSADGDGVHVNSAGGYAGYFKGDVQITGNLSKGTGSFKIDHPLDPENKYLYHSFVESPDMMNIYNGNVTLDASGEAWITLPDWFEALNRDFRYQLTPIGGPGPGLYIAEKVQNNRFKIAGGEPGLEISWQVTGIRQDPYAEANRILVEEEKPAEERGTYLHPEAYGQPETMGLSYREAQAHQADQPAAGR